MLSANLLVEWRKLGMSETATSGGPITDAEGAGLDL